MKKFLIPLAFCLALVISTPAPAAGLNIDLSLPVVHGGISLSVDKGVTLGVTIPVVGGGTKVGLLTPTDAVSVRLESPVTHKAVAVGCCEAGIPYGKSTN